VNPSLGAAVENILFSRLPKRDTPAGSAEASRSVALGERASGKKGGTLFLASFWAGLPIFFDERRNRMFRVSKPRGTYSRAVLEMGAPAQNDAMARCCS